MSTMPYEFGPVEFDAAGGAVTVVELRLPSRGKITAIRLIPLEGAFVGGTFRILTKRNAALDLTGSSASASLQGNDPDLYSVMGTKVFTVTGYQEFAASYEYRNRDGTYSNPVRRLWLIIQPVGAGLKTYAISMVISQDS